MLILTASAQLHESLAQSRKKGRTIGLVPTMGFLHAGHISLVRRARQENDVVAVTIFVNPTQFGPKEDLDAYPRDTRRDIELLEAEHADIVFIPAVDDIYPPGFTTYVEVEGPITQVLCGKSRPTHFRGVTTVVAKLFHMAAPDRAYFGQKDAQQVAVIRQMVKDLDFDLELVVCPIVRESDGLAMSSRNTYLSSGQRAAAAVLFRSLAEAQATIEQGERSGPAVVGQIRARIGAVRDAVIDYVAVVDARDLTDLEVLAGEVLIAVAVNFGKTRLIDNIQITI
jgi:pantoate--beta-alanine ligase